jgi:hypothetical protein
MPETSIFIELTRNGLRGRRTRANSTLSMLAEVIVGQGLERRKNKRRSLCST